MDGNRLGLAPYRHYEGEDHERYPGAALHHQQHYYPSHPEAFIRRAHSLSSRERTQIFYDNPASAFLTADSCTHHGYTTLRPERAQMFYDNPEGGFLSAGAPAVSHPPMHTHSLPLLGAALLRPHPLAPAQPLQDLRFGPSPLFGWGSVMPHGHSYGQPKYLRYQKPDHRRFCYSVGKAEVPYASLPGGPLWGYPAHMAEQLVRNRFQ
ncbi:hypothetical protein C366_01905 [Cryptococcus neoformans Tu401-1]|nr:hypothetical protein AYX15_00467 [Cryptococcus neoformans var. grubii]OXG20372.1 hypothetical protein C366_01905 [Cryptococcus neoformans var. grubii Tu401-1]OXM80239.1 hypothetical protein C364_01863 [Cryptococcus neoformans var. grubii Bt63]